MKKKRNRLLMVTIIIAISLFAVITKLTYIKIIKSNEYYQKAIDLWTRSAPIKGTRGNIYDRNGELIVGSYVTPTIVCIPKQVENPSRAASSISKILKVDSEKILNHLIKNVSVEIIKPEGQKLKVSEAVLISKLNLKGIYIVGDSSRYYPYNSCLSQVLGITGIDNQGITGIEAMYEEYLKGDNGALQIFTDAHGDDIFELSSLYDQAENGSDVYLTIDLDIQLSFERVLSNAMENYQAKEVSGIVINPKTSEILAMASFPTYDPSNYQDYDSTLYNRNIPIWKVYEPGSTFKICTFAAGLEEKVFSLDEIFYDPGYAMVDGTRLKDWKAGGHGKETFREVLQNSCNPGFVTIGLRLGKEKFFNYMKKFGFGEKTGIDLLGESSGILFNPDKISNVELATSAFGQGNAVTMLQLINASCAAVNGGILHQPYILKEIKKDDKTIYQNKTTEIRRVISEETSRKVAESLEYVVAKGTGRGSYIEGYRVGGKTGTAQIAENGKYATGKYILSFLGIAPMDDPEVAVIIALDSPQNTIQYGGVVAAPLVKEVLTESLSILNIEKRNNEVPFEARYWIDKNIYDVENYVGMNIGKILPNNNYRYIIHGDGLIVKSQVPDAGSKIIEGGYVILYT